MAPGTVAAFLEALRRRVAPACDAGVVRAVLERACAGAPATGRRPDGRRASVLTPSGVPFEASVSGGGGRPAAELRYVTEAGADVPFFGPRLAAQRSAAADLAGRLPGGPRDTGPELHAFLDALFPDPGAVPARTRLAALLGVVHRPALPTHVARLKVYGSLAADPGSLDRVAARWPAFAGLAGALDRTPGARPHFATLEVDASGGRVHKLYLRTRLDGPVEGLDVGPVRGDAYVCHTATVADGTEAAVSVHLPAKALGLDAAGMAALAARLAGTRHGTTDHAEALAAAAEAAGGAWAHTVVGVGRTGDDGAAGKLNVYVAPA